MFIFVRVSEVVFVFIREDHAPKEVCDISCCEVCLFIFLQELFGFIEGEQVYWLWGENLAIVVILKVKNSAHLWDRVVGFWLHEDVSSKGLLCNDSIVVV